MRTFIIYANNGKAIGYCTTTNDSDYDANVALYSGLRCVEVNENLTSIDGIAPITNLNSQFTASLSATTITVGNSATLSPIPDTTTLTISYVYADNTTGSDTSTVSTSATLNAVEAGTYTLTLSKTDYDDASYTVTVTA